MQIKVLLWLVCLAGGISCERVKAKEKHKPFDGKECLKIQTKILGDREKALDVCSDAYTLHTYGERTDYTKLLKVFETFLHRINEEYIQRLVDFVEDKIKVMLEQQRILYQTETNRVLESLRQLRESQAQDENRNIGNGEKTPPVLGTEPLSDVVMGKRRSKRSAKPVIDPIPFLLEKAYRIAYTTGALGLSEEKLVQLGMEELFDRKCAKIIRLETARTEPPEIGVSMKTWKDLYISISSYFYKKAVEGKKTFTRALSRLYEKEGTIQPVKDALEIVKEETWDEEFRKDVELFKRLLDDGFTSDLLAKHDGTDDQTFIGFIHVVQDTTRLEEKEAILRKYELFVSSPAGYCLGIGPKNKLNVYCEVLSKMGDKISDRRCPDGHVLAGDVRNPFCARAPEGPRIFEVP